MKKQQEFGPKYHYGVEAYPLMPNAEAFADLFEDGPGVHRWEVRGVNHKGRKTTDVCLIGDYIHQREPHASWKRKPRPEVAEMVKAHMINCGNDSIHFEIILTDDGRAWVFANYSQIIGHRYLANINATTIPEEG